MLQCDVIDWRRACRRRAGGARMRAAILPCSGINNSTAPRALQFVAASASMSAAASWAGGHQSITNSTCRYWTCTVCARQPPQNQPIGLATTKHSQPLNRQHTARPRMHQRHHLAAGTRPQQHRPGAAAHFMAAGWPACGQARGSAQRCAALRSARRGAASKQRPNARKHSWRAAVLTAAAAAAHIAAVQQQACAAHATLRGGGIGGGSAATSRPALTASAADASACKRSCTPAAHTSSPSWLPPPPPRQREVRARAGRRLARLARCVAQRLSRVTCADAFVPAKHCCLDQQPRFCWSQRSM